MNVNTIVTAQYIVSQCAYAIPVLGVIGNLINILVLTNLKIFRSNHCAFYLIVESISNAIQLSFTFILYLLLSIYSTDIANQNIFMCKFRVIVIGSCTIVSFSSICFSTFDQYLATNHKAFLRKLSTTKLSKILTLLSILLSMLHAIPFSIRFEIRKSTCGPFNIDVSRYLTYFFYPVLVSLLPIGISSLFSILAYRNVRHIIQRRIPLVRRRLDRQLTAMVLIRIIVFVSLILPFAIFRMFMYIQTINPSDLFLLAIINLIGTLINTSYNLNYAVPFYIFTFSSSRFRRQVKYLFRKKYWRKIRRRFGSNQIQVHPFESRASNDSEFALE